VAYQNLTYELFGSIAVVTINRPKSLNSLTKETIAELSVCFDVIAQDDAVRGVIVTGAGDKAFVAGADIPELATLNVRGGRQLSLNGQAAYNKIERLNKPVVAAVNGFALGGGCELAMACHLRVAAPHAKFGQPEVNLGLIPGYGGTQRLPRIVGKGKALELMMSGEIINAEEAYRIGLVNKIIHAVKTDDDGELLDEKGRPVFDRVKFLAETAEFLNKMLVKAPLAVGYCIEAVNRGLDSDVGEGLNVEADLFGLLYATQDTKEGLRAFVEKREAKFEGK